MDKINITDVNELLTLTLRSYYQDYPESSLENICKEVSCKFKFNNNIINKENLFSGCKEWNDFLLDGTFDLKFTVFKSIVLKAVKDKNLLNLLMDVKKRLNIFYSLIVYNDDLCKQVDKFFIFINGFIKETDKELNLIESNEKNTFYTDKPVNKKLKYISHNFGRVIEISNGKQFSLTPSQAEFVDILYKNWQNGNKKLLHKEDIASELDRNKIQPGDLFSKRNKEFYTDYIVHNNRGGYKLRD